MRIYDILLSISIAKLSAVARELLTASEHTVDKGSEYIEVNAVKKKWTKHWSDITKLKCILCGRFEKLDITPKSAQKLKPVLEKWLAEAEHWNQKGQQNLMEFVGGEPSKKRKRRTSFTPQAIEVLNSYFKKNALPTGQEITEIARELNYDREVVRVWFCNRRQTLKNTSKINVFQAQQWENSNRCFRLGAAWIFGAAAVSGGAEDTGLMEKNVCGLFEKV